MAYGLITKNASGGVQIDSEAPSLVLFEKRSATIPTSYRYAYWSVDITNISNGRPLFAFKPLSVPQFQIGWEWDGTYYRAELAQDPAEDGVVRYLDYAIYMPVNVFSAGGENYGIRIYNAAGEIVFRDDLDTMRVVGLYTGTQANDQDVYISVHNADLNYFSAFPRSFHVEGRLYEDAIYERTLKKYNSTTIILTPRITEMRSYAGDSAWLSNYTVIEMEPPF